MLRALATASAGAAFTASGYASGGEVASEKNHAAESFASVRKQASDAVARGEATGVAIALTQHGHIVWEEGFGWANREKGLRVTAHTPFCLASITKPFTTTTLMTLAAERKLSLDEPANTYLENKLRGPNGNPEGATVRRLGAHAAGLPSMFERFFPGEPTHAPSAEAVMHDYGELAYPPGGCYEYSNVGFAALAAIASNLTKTEFGTLMTERVLAPLGLHDSFFGGVADRLPRSAVGYDDSGNPIPYYKTSTPASGELYASAHDLARFAMFNLKDHLKDQSRILDDRWIDELHKPVLSAPSGAATTFGWFLGHTRAGMPILSKGGGQPGVATFVYMLPTEDLACVVLTNRSNNRDLVLGLCDQMLTATVPGWTRPEENVGPAQSVFVATPAFAGVWEGTLTDGGANIPVKLNIQSSDGATLALGDKPAQKIAEMKFEGSAFTGKTSGEIESPDAIRNQATILLIKLLPQGDKLAGRILAMANKPGTLLPYILTLHR